MNDSSDTPEQRPDKASFVPHAADLDALHAWEHFGGLSLTEAYEKFCGSPEYYQEDFMFMGGAAFAYYYPVIERYILESKVDSSVPPVVEGDCDVEAMWILAHCIKAHFDTNQTAQVEHLRPSILELVGEHVRANLAQYCAAAYEQQRLDGAWQELETRLRSDPPQPAVETPPPRRRWFRFGLRTLFIVVTVFACWLAWEARIVSARREMLAMVGERGGKIREGDPQSLPLVRRLLGDRPVTEIFGSYRSLDPLEESLTPDEQRRIDQLFGAGTYVPLPPPPSIDPNAD